MNRRVVFRACFIALCALAYRAAPAAEAASPSGESPAPAAVAALGSVLFVPLDVYNAPAGELPALNADAAANAFAKAREAVATGDVGGAFQHACAAVTLDPNHADARRLLGYQRIGDAWAGSFAQEMLENGFAWRPEYGWVKAADVAKYDEGLRPYGGKWISAQEDARRHAKISRAWAVRTDHFLIMTNLDRAAGVSLAMRLETDYQLWRQLFGEFAATTEELQARLDGKETAGYRRKPFRVAYHRDRQDYIDQLKARQSGIEMSLGVYFDATRESHFFAGEGQDLATIDHEAVHQFFYESPRQPARNLAATANVWAVEGVACYFESLAQRGGSAFAVGGADAGRLQAARHRRTVDNYYVPLAELTALGVADLQARSDIARLYSQSAGLASFFIDGQNGKYRDAFRQLLAEIYAGRDEPGTLARLTGRSYEQLDAEYLEFLKSLPVTAEIAP